MEHVLGLIHRQMGQPGLGSAENVEPRLEQVVRDPPKESDLRLTSGALGRIVEWSWELDLHPDQSQNRWHSG